MQIHPRQQHLPINLFPLNLWLISQFLYMSNIHFQATTLLMFFILIVCFYPGGLLLAKALKIIWKSNYWKNTIKENQWINRSLCGLRGILYYSFRDSLIRSNRSDEWCDQGCLKRGDVCVCVCVSVKFSDPILSVNLEYFIKK